MEFSSLPTISCEALYEAYLKRFGVLAYQPWDLFYPSPNDTYAIMNKESFQQEMDLYKMLPVSEQKYLDVMQNIWTLIEESRPGTEELAVYVSW